MATRQNRSCKYKLNTKVNSHSKYQTLSSPSFSSPNRNIQLFSTQIPFHMSGYPNQPTGYGYGAPPPSQYGAPPPSQYGAPPPSQSYGAPPPGQSYGAPPSGQSYSAPPSGQSYSASPYGQPSAPYAAPYSKPPKEGSHSQGSGGGYPPAASYGSPFASLVPSAFPPGTDPSIVACFQIADQDGSGFIDDKELQRALSSYNQSFSLRTVHLLMYHFTNSNVKKIGTISTLLKILGFPAHGANLRRCLLFFCRFVIFVFCAFWFTCMRNACRVL